MFGFFILKEHFIWTLNFPSEGMKNNNNSWNRMNLFFFSPQSEINSSYGLIFLIHFGGYRKDKYFFQVSLKQRSSNQPIIQKKRSKCTQPLCAELCSEALFSVSPGVISSISLQRFVTHSEIRSPVASPVGFRGVCLPRWTALVLYTNLEIPTGYNIDILPGLIKINL